MAKVRSVMSEKMRKKMSDKIHFKKGVSGIDMKKILVAKLKRKK